jgi:hypothetical protein
MRVTSKTVLDRIKMAKQYPKNNKDIRTMMELKE